MFAFVLALFCGYIANRYGFAACAIASAFCFLIWTLTKKCQGDSVCHDGWWTPNQDEKK